jgi:hypothetical protein
MDIGYDGSIYQIISDAMLDNRKEGVNPILRGIQSRKERLSNPIDKITDTLDSIDRGGLKRNKPIELDGITLTVLTPQRIKDRISVRQSKGGNHFDESTGTFVSAVVSDPVDMMFSPSYTERTTRQYQRYFRNDYPVSTGSFFLHRLGNRFNYRGRTSRYIYHRDLTLGLDYPIATMETIGDRLGVSFLSDVQLHPRVLKHFFSWLRVPQVELVSAWLFEGWEHRIISDSEYSYVLNNPPDVTEFMEYFSKFPEHSLIRLSEHFGTMPESLLPYFTGFGQELYYASHSDGIGIYRHSTGLPEYLKQWFLDYPLAERMTLRDKRKEDVKQWRKAGIKGKSKPGRVSSSFEIR